MLYAKARGTPELDAPIGVVSTLLMLVVWHMFFERLRRPTRHLWAAAIAGYAGYVVVTLTGVVR
jgi:hypothetical protein